MNITGKLLTIIVSTLVLSVFAAACGSDTPAVEEPTEETKVSQMEENVPEESTQPDPTPEPPTPEPTEAPPEDTANGTGRIGNELLAPELTQVFSWINSEPLTLEGLRGDVVLIDFWTYTCINCIRTLPYLKDWHDKYADLGLTIIGVHTPEFEFEKKKENVIDAVAEYGLEYPVVQDNDFGTWRAFENRYWPAKYLIDKDGYIRYSHFGEGAYQETEEEDTRAADGDGQRRGGNQPGHQAFPGGRRGRLRRLGVRDQPHQGAVRGLRAQLRQPAVRPGSPLRAARRPPGVLHPARRRRRVHGPRRAQQPLPVPSGDVAQREGEPEARKGHERLRGLHGAALLWE